MSLSSRHHGHAYDHHKGEAEGFPQGPTGEPRLRGAAASWMLAQRREIFSRNPGKI